MPPSDFSNDCCTIPPAKPLDQYESKGTYKTIGSSQIPCYFTGSPDSKRAVIVYYDIFGLHKNTEQTCDMLASQNLLVIMVDFFKGNMFPGLSVPGGFDRTALFEHLQKVANVEIVNALTNEVVEYLKSELGIKDLGAMGFCWGGKQVILMESSTRHYFSAIAGIHPSGITKELIQSMRPQTAVCLLPTSAEMDITTTEEFLKPVFDGRWEEMKSDKEVQWAVERSEVVDFHDVHHG
ncbi:hypothetical protein HDU76_012672, partial [Blyttiomyces sp. JEL0837]